MISFQGVERQTEARTFGRGLWARCFLLGVELLAGSTLRLGVGLHQKRI